MSINASYCPQNTICPPNDNWDPTKNATFCAIPIYSSNRTNVIQLESAFQTCCGSVPIATYSNGCYEYCNISANEYWQTFNACMAYYNEGAACWNYYAQSAASPGKGLFGIMTWLILVGWLREWFSRVFLPMVQRGGEWCSFWA